MKKKEREKEKSRGMEKIPRNEKRPGFLVFRETQLFGIKKNRVL